MTVERKVQTGRKIYVPVSSSKTSVVGERVAASRSVKSKDSAEAPMQFYTRVSKRSDVRKILQRLAKD